MAFKDLDEFFDPALKLPMRGKVYRIESPDAGTGLWCQRLMSTAVKAAGDVEVTEDDLTGLQLDDEEEKNLFARIMGDAYGQMFADHVPWEWIKHAGVTCLVWITRDAAAAEKYWNAGGTSPKAKKPQDRKKPAKKKSAQPASRGGSTPQRTAKKAQPGGTS